MKVFFQRLSMHAGKHPLVLHWLKAGRSSLTKSVFILILVYQMTKKSDEDFFVFFYFN